MDLYTTAVTKALKEFRDTYEIDTVISSDLERMLLVAGREQPWNSLTSTPSVVRVRRRAPRKTTGYNLYIKEMFKNRSDVAEEKDQNSQKLMSLYSKNWKLLDEDKRAVYNDQAKDENQSSGSVTGTRATGRRNAGQHRVTGYNIFYRDNRHAIKEALAEGETLMASVGAKWKALSESEKDEWRARGKEETESRTTDAPDAPAAEETA